MFIYVHTHWPEQHLFVRSFRETNLRRKGNQSFRLFSVLCCLASREEDFFFYFIVRVVVAIICKLLDLAQMNTRQGTTVLNALYVQQ